LFVYLLPDGGEGLSCRHTDLLITLVSVGRRPILLGIYSLYDSFPKCRDSAQTAVYSDLYWTTTKDACLLRWTWISDILAALWPCKVSWADGLTGGTEVCPSSSFNFYLTL